MFSYCTTTVLVDTCLIHTQLNADSTHVPQVTSITNGPAFRYIQIPHGMCIYRTWKYYRLPWKVRPRTSAWYSLDVDATRQNVILPDLPGYIRACLIIGTKFPLMELGVHRCTLPKTSKNWQFLSCSLVSDILCINIHKYILCLVLPVYI
jgi:hypothetical protein